MSLFYRRGLNKKLGEIVNVFELYCMHAESGGIDLLSSPHCGWTRGACKSEAPQNAIHITVERRNRSDNFPPEIMGGRHFANYLSAKCPPTVLLLPLARRWCVVYVWFRVLIVWFRCGFVWFGVVGGGLIWVQILDWTFYSSRKKTNPHTKPICEREAV